MDRMINSGIRIREALARIQGEYEGVPGLRLTELQAQHLWHLDRAVCDGLLMALVDARFLVRTPEGAFVLRRPDTSS
jgi:hypothetical protein